ncbi:MAG: EAL domain-containing protein [Oscillatoria sp. PMC 1068.18]|nr:EAL domain-containing protein [Oscillatoria sp. PMC 1076.18]MEC4989271.1 EAL domain-containing protein [Oscillatoria sp. PMC 1068.18]
MAVPEKKTQERLMPNREDLLNRITSQIRQSLELPEILETAAREIRLLLNTDRIKIYAFLPDGSGEVIAESCKKRSLPTLQGLRFPADDIPQESRELFIKSQVRVIVDVVSGQKTSEALENSENEENLRVDRHQKEDIRYTPVDPCHQEYLKAMGVASSLVLPILVKNHLWGLLVSHHRKPRHYSERELQIVQLLVDQISIAIAQSQLLAKAQQQAQHEATINKISALLHSPQAINKIQQTVLEQTVEALRCDSGRLYITPVEDCQEAQIYCAGEQANIGNLEEKGSFWQQILYQQTEPNLGATELDLFLSERESVGDSDQLFNLGIQQLEISEPQIYKITDLKHEPQLEDVISLFEERKINSLLIVPLRYQQQCVGCLTLFRQETETETLWAGQANHDRRNRRPRKSFAAWREIVKGKAKPWTGNELKLAQTLGIHLYLAVMQRRVEEMIRHHAYHDQLTGLPNRRLFNEGLYLALANAQLSRGEMLAVLFLDLDGFKNINDTLGHAVGDILLKQVAQRLENCMRGADILARWGGDEFTILLSPLANTTTASAIAVEVLAALNLPFSHANQQFYIKGSVGVALAPYHGKDADTLLKNADAAMYGAKQQGRNTYQVYTPAIGTKLQKRLTLENNLYKALEHQEFTLYYQPQISLSTGEIVGMEALIRWRSPELGLVSPAQFIPLAEETGLIIPLGKWILQTACEQVKIWQSQGLPPIRIAVNLSARQFQEQNLLKTITQVLATTGIEPKRLELEITESIAMQDVEYTISVLNSLREIGIQISMDDFGTGYSALSSLKHFPLDKLKIDRSFIRDLTVDSHDAAIVAAVMALGHGLNLEVVAEGVETEEQFNFLRSLQCDVLQGYFFSRPLPTEAATELFRQQKFIAWTTE